MRNVLDELPREQQPQVVNMMRAAWKLTDADDGMKRLEGLARFLEHDYESAARSLREGMAEMFTMQRLKIPPSLYKCLGTTNVIESPQSGVQKRTINVTRWRDGAMVERWVASAWLLTEKHFRKVIGHRDFWALAVILGREKHCCPVKTRTESIDCSLRPIRFGSRMAGVPVRAPFRKASDREFVEFGKDSPATPAACERWLRVHRWRRRSRKVRKIECSRSRPIAGFSQGRRMKAGPG
jgi:hypothetical protein